MIKHDLPLASILPLPTYQHFCMINCLQKVIECYIRAILNSKDTTGRLHLMNHYTMGAILHGTREQMARQGLQNVSITVIIIILLSL